MAGGAYLRAKKGMREFAEKSLVMSAGVVSAMVGGPRRPEEVMKTSSLDLSVLKID